jgi:hypothetical protein
MTERDRSTRLVFCLKFGRLNGLAHPPQAIAVRLEVSTEGICNRFFYAQTIRSDEVQ